MDFSGTEAKIISCTIDNTGDKGISGGEQSILKIKNLNIKNSKIGFASKDNSKIEAINCKLSNCVYGIIVFQKKPEYGASQISVTDLKWNSIINLYYVEKKSVLFLNGRKISGNKTNVAKIFY